jgi:hypothetical protein
VRPKRFEQVDDAFAMLCTDRQRLAQAERERFQPPGLAAAAFGLVGGDDYRRSAGPQPAADLLVERRQSFAGVDQEQGDIGIAHRRFGLLAHPPGKGLRVLVFVAGGIDDAELEPEQVRVALAPIAGHARPVVDQRQLLADKPVEEGRFTDIWPADDCDGGNWHRDASASRSRNGQLGRPPSASASNAPDRHSAQGGAPT